MILFAFPKSDSCNESKSFETREESIKVLQVLIDNLPANDFMETLAFDLSVFAHPLSECTFNLGGCKNLPKYIDSGKFEDMCVMIFNVSADEYVEMFSKRLADIVAANPNLFAMLSAIAEMTEMATHKCSSKHEDDVERLSEKIYNVMTKHNVPSDDARKASADMAERIVSHLEDKFGKDYDIDKLGMLAMPTL